MAEGILVLKTPPGRLHPAGPPVVAGTYEVLFIYNLDPPILDWQDVQVAPTPSTPLLQLLGQDLYERYIQDPAPARFDSGAWGWEHEVGSRIFIKETPEDPPRPETRDELIVRLLEQFADAKARAVAEWTETYRFSGRLLEP